MKSIHSALAAVLGAAAISMPPATSATHALPKGLFNQFRRLRRRSKRKVPSGRKLYSVEKANNPAQVAKCLANRERRMPMFASMQAKASVARQRKQIAPFEKLRTRCGLWNASFNGAQKP